MVFRSTLFIGAGSQYFHGIPTNCIPSQNPQNGHQLRRIHFWQQKLSRKAVQLIGSRFYLNPNPSLHKSILVAGTARSGTTWLGDLIAAQIPCRILFEPFNPVLVPEYKDFHYFQYMKPGTEDTKLHAFAEKVFSGKIRNRWVDRQNERIKSKYRLIKEIRGNLILRWLHDNFPEVPIVFLLRHPCAVVASRMELNWATDDDIESFLIQPDLISNHLTPYMDIIKSSKTDEEKHAVIWCISNLVPLKQFRSDELKIVYYETLVTQPEKELSSILKSIGQANIEPDLNTIDRPSQTTIETSPVITGKDKISNWKKQLSPDQIKNILNIVDSFELGYLYNETVLPVNSNAN